MHEARQAVVDEDKLEEELGDLLFATVNLTRHLGKKAETALQKANRKFERRFRQVEDIIQSQGHSLHQASLEEMEAAWQQIKLQETGA
jgi:ATP diphosphatase